MNQSILDTLLTLAKEKPPEVRNFRICAAVVLKHKEVVSLGFPRRKSHPLQKEFGRNSPRSGSPLAIRPASDTEYSVFLHAEVDALLRARKEYPDLGASFSLYVARVKHRAAQDDSYVVGNAKPCIGCMRFIHRCGIEEIHYTNDSLSVSRVSTG